VAEGGDERSGRWVGQGKAECGIHLPLAVEPATTDEGQTVAAG